MDTDYDKVVKAFISIRDARNKLRQDYEAEDKALKDSQTRLENYLLDHLNNTNTDSVKTAAGTFYRQEEVTPTASDWSAVYDWIKDNNAFEALERRLKKTFVKDYMEEHDEPPPGVSVFREYVVRVRRSS